MLNYNAVIRILKQYFFFSLSSLGFQVGWKQQLQPWVLDNRDTCFQQWNGTRCGYVCQEPEHFAGEQKCSPCPLHQQ